MLTRAERTIDADPRIKRLTEAAHDDQRISGLTHTFYRYPARFSPAFTRAAIKEFTNPGDVVLDPFMGGGTSLVEAYALRRRAVGTDISSLAQFISEVKTTILSEYDEYRLEQWRETTCHQLRESVPPADRREVTPSGDIPNLDTPQVWPVRYAIEKILEFTEQISLPRQERFARCVLLNVAQWALDNRRNIPGYQEFVDRYEQTFNELLAGAEQLRVEAVRSWGSMYSTRLARPICAHRSVIGIETDPMLSTHKPKLIITSPPYPGIHVLYHRWQIRGRRETPAPFWIAGTKDGHGASYYTFGDRKSQGLRGYWQGIKESYASLAEISTRNTVLVQLVAFSNPDEQLPLLIEALDEAGFRQVSHNRSLAETPDSYVWRNVPNRKWYRRIDRSSAERRELVLVHMLK